MISRETKFHLKKVRQAMGGRLPDKYRVLVEAALDIENDEAVIEVLRDVLSEYPEVEVYVPFPQAVDDNGAEENGDSGDDDSDGDDGVDEVVDDNSTDNENESEANDEGIQTEDTQGTQAAKSALERLQDAQE